MEHDLVQYAKAGWYFLGFAAVDVASIVCLKYLLKRNDAAGYRSFSDKKRMFMFGAKTKNR